MRRRDRRKATTGALVGSVLVHLAVFAWFVHQATPRFLATPETAEPDFTLELAPLPSAPRPHEESSPPPRRVAPVVAARRAPPASQTTKAIQAPRRPPPRNAPSAPPAPPARASANVPSAGAAAPAPARPQPRPAKPWAVTPDDGQDGVRSVLRATVGCSHEDYAHLNETERAACDRRIGREGREGSERVDGLSAEARASFDAAVEERERMRAAGRGAMGSPITPCKGPGSNMDRGCLNPNGGVGPP